MLQASSLNLELLANGKIPVNKEDSYGMTSTHLQNTKTVILKATSSNLELLTNGKMPVNKEDSYGMTSIIL